MDYTYDVIIVGGSFSGLSVASILSRSGLNILLVERDKKIGLNDNPVRGTFTKTINKYDLMECVLKEYDAVNFYGTKSRAKITLDRDKVCLFDSTKLLNILKKKVKCRVLTNCEIISAKRKNHSVVLTDNNGNEYAARIVVDASGRSSVVARSFGISKSRVYCKCYIALLSNCNLNSKEAYYFSSPKISNGSAWVEPLSEKKCQIGIADFEPYTISNKDSMRSSLLYLMNDFRASKEMLSHSKIVKGSERCISYPVGPMDTMVLDNVLAVGDSAGQATPLLGEGIRVGLDMAEACARAVELAFSKKDFSAKALGVYEDEWWREYGKFAGWGVLLRHYIAKNFRDKDWNMTIKKLEGLNSQEKEAFLKSRMTYSIFQKVSSFELKKKMMESKLKELFPNLNSLRQRYFVSHFV